MEGLWQTTDLQTWGKCPLARHTPSSIGSCSVNVNFRTQGVMYLGSVSEDNHADNPGDRGTSLLLYRLAAHPACLAWGAATLSFIYVFFKYFIY